MDERMRRLWAASEATALGHGGIGVVARATGLARATISNGCRELRAVAAGAPALPPRRVRRPGGGRKPLTAHDPDLVTALEALVDPLARGDPESPLRWTTKSTYQLAATLRAQGHRIGPWKVGQLLRERGYSLQATRKTREGRQHADRDAQFEQIKTTAAQFQARGQPVTHDFPDRDLGKAIPYGVYDLAANAGWVSVGIDHDTAAFAVASIQQWWEQMGAARYPQASELLITADGGGSNGYRLWGWKVGLQRLAEATGLTITVCHFPPGTSKWNKIEHRMFSAITKNWRGRPLESLETIVSLIGETRTRTGLQIQVALDEHAYPTGVKVSPEQRAQLRLEPAAFHGEWNYTLRPRNQQNN